MLSFYFKNKSGFDFVIFIVCTYPRGNRNSPLVHDFSQKKHSSFSAPLWFTFPFNPIYHYYLNSPSSSVLCYSGYFCSACLRMFVQNSTLEDVLTFLCCREKGLCVHLKSQFYSWTYCSLIQTSKSPVYIHTTLVFFTCLKGVVNLLVTGLAGLQYIIEILH